MTTTLYDRCAQDAAASGETVRIASTVAPVPLLEDGFDPFARTL